jgi:hypothetical protein
LNSIGRYLKFSHWIFIALIICISYRFYSYKYNPALNSDHAVIVLMTDSFEWPDNAYFWGQDRYGAIVPLVAQVFKLFGISSIIASSIAQYTILIFGFICAATFIRQKFWKIIFASIWFLPPSRLIEWLGFYSGIELSFVFMALFLIKRIKEKRDLNYFTFTFYTMAICVFSILAIWISDMALVTMGIVFCTQIILMLTNYFYVERIKAYLMMGVIFMGILAGFMFIGFVKSNAANHQAYSEILPFAQIIKSITILGNSLIQLLNFSSNDPSTSIFLYLFILLVFLIIGTRQIKRSIFRQTPWLTTFLLDLFILTGAILAAKFTLDNNVPRRYFTCFYIEISLVVIIIIEKLNLNYLKTTIARVIGVSLCFCGLFSILQMKLIWPGTLIPRSEFAKEFEKMAPISIIGNYWSSYIYSITMPKEIKTTPEYFGAVRNLKLNTEVLESPNVYIIKDMWLDYYPDTLTVQNHRFKKSGLEFICGDANVCRYENLGRKEE